MHLDHFVFVCQRISPHNLILLYYHFHTLNTIVDNHVYFNSFGTNYVKNIKNGGKKNNEMVR